MRVLAVGAHPDDLELLCGGTLARFAAAGDQVVMCHVALGDCGSLVDTAEEIGRVRWAEADAAAAVIGATHETLGLSDAKVHSGNEGQQALMIDVIRRAQPDLIITHAPNDYMADHNEVSKLVFDCSYFASVPLVLGSSGLSPSAVTPIYYMDTLAGAGFLPTHFVDITETFAKKREMLAAHASQVSWIGGHDETDMSDLMDVSARFRGHQCGAAYAEAFIECQVWGRAVTRRLLP
jgi:LmbE family N-acetylglucosaminyl deacetylase